MKFSSLTERNAGLVMERGYTMPSITTAGTTNPAIIATEDGLNDHSGSYYRYMN